METNQKTNCDICKVFIPELFREYNILLPDGKFRCEECYDRDEKVSDDGLARGDWDDVPENRKKEMIGAAIKLVVSKGKVAAAMLQRNMVINFQIAIAILEELEQMGIIGGISGEKPREIYIQCVGDPGTVRSLEEFRNKYQPESLKNPILCLVCGENKLEGHKCVPRYEDKVITCYHCKQEVLPETASIHKLCANKRGEVTTASNGFVQAPDLYADIKKQAQRELLDDLLVHIIKEQKSPTPHALDKTHPSDRWCDGLQCTVLKFIDQKEKELREELK